MFPRLVVDLKKLEGNLDAVSKLVKEDAGCSLAIVTKCVCADPEVVDLLLKDSRVDFLADSRVQNLKTFASKARAVRKRTILLRVPMQSEAAEVVRYADISFNSEIATIRKLNEEAARQGIRHSIVLMVDMGDLREGIFYQKEDLILDTVRETEAMSNVDLIGVAVNLTCYGAIIPKPDNLGGLVDMAKRIEGEIGRKLEIVSGGNSSSIYLIWKGGLPEGITNLRLGESFLLGNDTAYGEDVPGTCRDAFILEAEIVELQEKPSMPIGEIGVDAFGEKPHYEDRGMMKRAIVGIGKQDADLGNMEPVDPDIEILGASSDHMILNLTNCKQDLKVGDVVRFNLAYGGLLKVCTSSYVERIYVR